MKDSGEAITPKAWQREIDQLAAGKQADTLAMKSMREDLKAVERLRKTAEQLSQVSRPGAGAVKATAFWRTLVKCVAFHDILLHTEKPPYRFPHTAADCLFAEQVARVEDTITEFYQPADAVCCGRTTGLWVCLPSLESGLLRFAGWFSARREPLSSLRHRYPSPLSPGERTRK